MGFHDLNLNLCAANLKFSSDILQGMSKHGLKSLSEHRSSYCEDAT